jgi:hypothetical protein
MLITWHAWLTICWHAIQHFTAIIIPTVPSLTFPALKGNQGHPSSNHIGHFCFTWIFSSAEIVISVYLRYAHSLH